MRLLENLRLELSPELFRCTVAVNPPIVRFAFVLILLGTLRYGVTCRLPFSSLPKSILSYATRARLMPEPFEILNFCGAIIDRLAAC